MGLINILLFDEKNKLCQKMLSLREDTELLICNNINTINGDKPYLMIRTIDYDFSTFELENKGWKTDDGLYDKLIINYNNSKDRIKILTRWR